MHTSQIDWRPEMVRRTSPVFPIMIVLAALAAPVHADAPGRGQSTDGSIGTEAVVEANTEFALDLYGKVRERPGNLVISPYSISSALVMTYAGAKHGTAAQMAGVLGFAPEDQSLHAAFRSITDELHERAKAGAVDLTVANGLWVQEGKQLLDGFADLAEEDYDAGLEHVDFAGDSEAALKTINAWVARESKKRIKDILREGALGPSTALALTNAIYFRGNWAVEFDKDKSEPGDFWIRPDSSVSVQMMRRKDQFNYNETETLRALELPYADSSFSMMVLIPKSRDGLGEVEHSLAPQSLGRWLSLMRERMMIVELPRFEVRSDFELDETLKTMGMTDAFTPGLADFSGMTGDKDLFIGAVVHAASLKVDEQGSEAAAGTAVEVKKRYPVLRVDHPFLFLIRDNGSGSILFMGRVTDPMR
jgi:serpin B